MAVFSATYVAHLKCLYRTVLSSYCLLYVYLFTVQKGEYIISNKLCITFYLNQAGTQQVFFFCSPMVWRQQHPKQVLVSFLFPWVCPTAVEG